MIFRITKNYIAVEIQKTLKSGGCVVLGLPWSRSYTYVYDVNDISFGFIIGSSLPRITFITPVISNKWSYGKMTTVPSKADYKECLYNEKPK